MESSPPFDRALVVYNSSKLHDRRFEGTRRQIDYFLRAYDLPYVELATDADVAQTRGAVESSLQAGDVAISFGGDGSHNTVAEALMRSGLSNDAWLLAAPAGSANDLSRSLNGRLHGRKALVEIVDKGQEIAIRPMVINIQNKRDGTLQKYFALNNAGFGYTAEFARLLNQPAHRKHSRLRPIPLVGPWLQDGATGLRSARQEKLTTFRLCRESDSARRFDETFVHARRAAKVGRYAVRHTDGFFLDISTERADKASILKGMAATMIGRSGGERCQAASFQVEGRSILGHVDGETFEVADGSNVSVWLSDIELQTYSLYAARHDRC